MGHVVMENRHGLAAAGLPSKATGIADRRASEGDAYDPMEGIGVPPQAAPIF